MAINFELLIIPIIFSLSLILLLKNFKAAMVLLLVLSLFLHKELFSIYRWDVLPVRVFMLALLIYALWQVYLFLKVSPSRKNTISALKKYLSDPFVLLLSLLWLIRGISIVFTKNPQSSILLFGFFTTVFALSLLIYSKYGSDAETVLKFIRTYIFLIFLAALFGFVQLYIFYSQGVVIGAMWPVPGNIPRLGSTFWDVNHFAGLVAASLPVLGVFILTDTGWKKKLLNIVMFAVLLAVLILTNSRTAWMIAFFSFISFVLVLLYRRFRFKGVLFLFATLVILTIPIVNEYQNKASPFRAKVKDYFHYRIDSFDSHILLLRGAIEVFEERSVLGGGYGGFFEHFSKTDVAAEYFGRDPAALNTRVPAHTIWGELLSETGIFGFSTYLLLFSLIIGTMIYAALNLKDRAHFLITSAMGSALVGWLIAGVFYSYKAEFFWLIVLFYFTYTVAVLGSKFDVSKIIEFFVSSDKFPVTVISILALILIFVGLGTNHFIPWDEAIYAEIAKNMVESGEIFVMRWWGEGFWYEKPPMFIWSIALSMKLFGFSEFAARLPSAIFGFSTVILVYFFGKKIYSRLTGFISAFVLLTTFQFLYYTRASMVDVMATFFITLSLYLYWLAKENDQIKYWVYTGIAIGLASMTKGVVGLLPFLVIAIYEFYLFRTSQQSKFSSYLKKYLYMIGTSALIFLPWHIYSYYRFGIEFVNMYFIYHVFDRATSAIEDKGRPIYWYLIVLKVSMRIWFVVLLLAFPTTFIMAFFGNLKGLKEKLEFDIHPRVHTFLLTYSVSIFLFFSIARSKLVWYVMPLYPVLALIVGMFLARVIQLISKDKLILKFLMVYFVFALGLTYLISNKELIYISDLTGKQVQLLALKDQKFGTDSVVYADRIELPLILFYSDSPYNVVDFGTLRDKLFWALPNQQVVFITKESRLRKFKEIRPEIKLVERLDEWVLAELPGYN